MPATTFTFQTLISPKWLNKYYPQKAKWHVYKDLPFPSVSQTVLVRSTRDEPQAYTFFSNSAVFWSGLRIWSGDAPAPTPLKLTYMYFCDTALCAPNLQQSVYIMSPEQIMWPIFTARRSYASAVLGVVILSVCPSVRLSVCPSVCLSHACFVTKPNNALRIFWHNTKG